MKKLRATLLVAAVCLSCQNASAELFTVGNNLAANTYIGPGSSLSACFDLNSLIPADGQYNVPYDIISAEYTFYFADDGDLQFQHETYSSYYCVGSGGFFNKYYIYQRYHYTYYDDEYEQVQVAIEGENSAGGTASYSTQQYTGADVTSSWNIYRTYNYDRVYGYTGSLTLTQSLGAGALAALSNDGIVDFTLTATTGDIIYMGGQLTVDVEPNPTPVPGAVLLGMIGLSVAGVKLRKRA